MVKNTNFKYVLKCRSLMRYYNIGGKLTYDGARALERDISALVIKTMFNRGLSNQDVSELIGVPQQFLSHVRSGRFFLPKGEIRGEKAVSRLYALLDGLGITSAHFMEDLHEIYPNSPRPSRSPGSPIKPAEENLASLTPSDKARVDGLVQRIVDSYSKT